VAHTKLEQPAQVTANNFPPHHTHTHLIAGNPPFRTHFDRALAKCQNGRKARLKGNKLTPLALSNKKALRRHCMFSGDWDWDRGRDGNASCFRRKFPRNGGINLRGRGSAAQRWNTRYEHAKCTENKIGVSHHNHHYKYIVGSFWRISDRYYYIIFEVIIYFCNVSFLIFLFSFVYYLICWCHFIKTISKSKKNVCLYIMRTFFKPFLIIIFHSPKSYDMIASCHYYKCIVVSKHIGFKKVL